SSCSRSSALSFTTYFLTEISLPATNHLHRRIAATEIQKNTADSTTLATKKRVRLFFSAPCQTMRPASPTATKLIGSSPPPAARSTLTRKITGEDWKAYEAPAEAN